MSNTCPHVWDHGCPLCVLNPRKRIREKVIGDTLYTFSRAFRVGAWDRWRLRAYDNPYRYGSQRAADWEDGNALADAGDITPDEVGPEPQPVQPRRRRR